MTLSSKNEAKNILALPAGGVENLMCTDISVASEVLPWRVLIGLVRFRYLLFRLA